MASQQPMMRGYALIIADPGQQEYTTPGSYTWTAPASAAASGIDIVVIGGGYTGISCALSLAKNFNEDVVKIMKL